MNITIKSAAVCILITFFLYSGCKKEDPVQPDQTINRAPGAPSRTSTSDEAFNQPTSLTLSWQSNDPDGDPVSYDVYFGESDPPGEKVSESQSQSNLRRNDLNFNSTYYWQICARDDKDNSTKGQIWKFSTLPEELIGEPCEGIPTIEYQGKIYNTIQIGDQCWLKENLDVGVMISGGTNQSNNGIVEKYCYGDVPENCGKYGGLYQWNEAMKYSSPSDSQGVCPPGWHLPSREEFLELKSNARNDGHALKAFGQGRGTNISGFSALLAGFHNSDNSYSDLSSYTGLWSSDEINNETAYVLSLYDFNINIDVYYYVKQYGFSIRCLKN